MVKDLMRELREQGTTILMSTHQMHQVEELCDRIVLINQGRDVLYGNLNQIRRRYSGHAVLVQAANGQPLDPALVQRPGRGGDQGGLQIAGVVDVALHNSATKLTLADGTTPQDVLRALVVQDVVLERFEIAVPTVDEIFIRVVEEGD